MNVITVPKRSAKAFTPNAFAPPFPGPLQVHRPDLILVDYGPLTLTVSVWADGEPRPVMAARAAVLALEVLGELAAIQPLMKKPSGKIKNPANGPTLLSRAVQICRAISPELTGLAAVAGLTADEVLQEAVRLGADRVIVNNGGDVALITCADQPVRVGLKTHPEGEVTHYLEIAAEDKIGGVATSGWTGRSFSTGVADIVSVWAGDCTTADAAATWIAARTDVRSGRVFRTPAGALDPETDIPLLKVTREVGRLTQREKKVALEKGLAEAERLVEKRIIRGAFLAVQGETRWIGTPGGPEPRALIRK
ncbi:MAG: FAD:protein FMN transferase [Deltaproteobacteria bacterium]|nr:FAD:protein FMN transferase [Deltaproteobacteria bacterium]